MYLEKNKIFFLATILDFSARHQLCQGMLAVSETRDHAEHLVYDTSCSTGWSRLPLEIVAFLAQSAYQKFTLIPYHKISKNLKLKSKIFYETGPRAIGLLCILLSCVSFFFFLNPYSSENYCIFFNYLHTFKSS